MPADAPLKREVCNCLALRQAARHVTQFYDQFLAPSGLRTTQFSILAKLRLEGPTAINALAKRLVMDRTALGRNILPHDREAPIATAPGSTDPRGQEPPLAHAGAGPLR